MSIDLETLYSSEFYTRFDDESSKSAQVCVPLIIDLLGPRTVVDFGCGIGQWLSVFASHGVADCLGIDGPHVNQGRLRIPRQQFQAHDFSRPLRLGRRFHLSMSLEVGEHLLPGRAAEFVELLTAAAPAVVFSAALPGQGGFGHVNEQWPWYWKELFGARGYVQLDPFRKAIWHNRDVAYYYQQNLFLYVDPAVHGPLIGRIGVPDKYNELTLVRTSILQELTGPAPATRFLSASALGSAGCSAGVKRAALASLPPEEVDIMGEAATATTDQPCPGGSGRRLIDGVSWRWRYYLAPRIKRLLGIHDVQWARVVSDRDGEAFVRSLDYRSMDVLEISSTSDRWRNLAFQSYSSTSYPDYDVCAGPLRAQAFDLVIAEQVLEHVQRPFQAVSNVWKMLKPGGWFLVSTPFLIRVHAYPDDCSRWTEQGLKHLLMECGFVESGIRTASWGNRACVRANFRRFPSWIPWWHSLRNEPLFPVVVWAYAQKQTAEPTAAKGS